MLDHFDNLDHLIAAILPLDQARMIAAVEEARRRAGARADLLVLSRKQARQAWDEVERLGRLLFFLKFGRSAPNASPHEVSLYEEFMAARRYGRGCGAACRAASSGRRQPTRSTAPAKAAASPSPAHGRSSSRQRRSTARESLVTAETSG